MKDLAMTPVSEIRLLSREETFAVSGGVMIEGDGSHGVQTHVPGRLGPDETERGTIAGAGL